MRFLFFPSDFPPLEAGLLDKRPLSGGPTSLIRLAEALHSLGHEVLVLTESEHPQASQGPAYISLQEYENIGPVDVLIAVRGWMAVFLPIQYKKCFFWTGDSMENAKTFGIGDGRFALTIDALFAKSKWHAKTLSETSGFPLDKTWVLYNAVYTPYFEKKILRKKKRLIYSSTPQRGLQFLIPIFKEIKNLHPDAELYIYSSFDRNARKWPPLQYDLDEPYQSILDEAAEIPGCYVHSSIKQEALAEEFLKSALLVYPTNFLETCCNFVLEAQAAGCPVVTTDSASMRETVGDGGILIEGDASMSDYQRKFIEIVDKFFKDPAYYAQVSQNALRRSTYFGWKFRAKELVEYLKTSHGLK